MVNGKGLIDILGFRSGISALCRLECGLDQLGDTTKTNPTGNKGRHVDFVGLIENSGGSPPGFERPASERQRREAIRIRRLEGQRADLSKVELGRRSVDPGRP